MQVGPYRVVEEIARGGMGVVYRAQGANGEQAALKLLLAHRAESARARKRFQLEVQALARLRHPGVVSILGAGEHEGSPWLALDYVEGESLESRLRRGPLPIHEAIRVAQQLAQALSYVHSCGLLHRDLKPDNVLLRGNETLLTDFGLVLDDQSSHSRLTATGVFQGTPGYWAPEQAQGLPSQHGPQTDVYGLGAVLYACLTGQPPVRAATLQEYLHVARFTTIRAPRRERPDVPKWLSELCMRCLALEPTQRPSTAEEVARSLILAGGPPGRPTEARRQPKALVALLVAVGALGIVGAWGGWKATAPEPAESVESPPGRLPAEPAPEPIAQSPDPAPEPIAEPSDPAAEPPTQSAQSLGEEVVAKVEAKRYAEAIEVADRALALDPSLGFVWILRGVCKAELGQHAQALPDYDRALELVPQSAMTWRNRGLSRAELGQHAQAIADYDRALQLKPEDATGWHSRGLSNGKLGRPEQALEDFDRALELNPRHAVAWRNRGLTKELLERYAEAIEDFDKALEVTPQDGVVYWHRGASKAKLGRHAEAITDYDRALDLLPPAGAQQVRKLRVEAAAKLN